MRDPMKVCQNCINSSNDKGKWKRTWRRRALYKNNPDKEGYWHIFCELKQRFYPWDRRKRCFNKIDNCKWCVVYSEIHPKSYKKCGTVDCKHVKIEEVIDDYSLEDEDC